MMIIDATDLIVGRLAQYVAKKALEGEQIEILNSEKAIITGKKKEIIKHYNQKVKRGDPHHGPFYPKSAERILRRIIRGMLPWGKQRGREAYKRIHCYKGNVENKETQTFEEFNVSKLKKLKYLTLEQISKELK